MEKPCGCTVFQWPVFTLLVLGNGNCASSDRLQWEGHSVTSVVFLLKMCNLYPVMRKPQANWGTFCKITGLWSSKSLNMKVKERLRNSRLTESKEMIM